MAWALPHRVERLAILGCGGPFDVPGALDGMRRMNRMLWSLARWQPRPLRRLLRWQGSRAVRDPEGFNARMVGSLRGADREAVAELPPDRQGHLFSPDFVEAMRQGPDGAVEDMRLLRAQWGFPVEAISAPVHLWHGVDDACAPVAMGRWLADRIPDCDAHIEPDEGHVSLILRHSGEALDVLLG